MTDDEIIERACQIVDERFANHGESLTTSQATLQYMKARIGHLPYEVFCCIWLDNRHRVRGFEILFRGTIDGATVYSREVVKAALKVNAAACIVGHQHPSGISEPSRADTRLTERLRDALALVEVRLLDSIIIGEGEPYSMAERGLI